MAGEMLTADQALIARLQDRVQQLERDVAERDQVISAAQRSTEKSLVNLRHQLSPLYKALQQVFGELDALGGDEEQSAGAAGAPSIERAYYDTWKRKLGLGAGKIIDALLDHGPMTIQALAVATGYNRNSIPQYLAELRKVSLIETVGGKQQLKRG